ncbi:MAG: hypothetical protein ACRDZ7_10435 [Acidimicrobiia bacterium]
MITQSELALLLTSRRARERLLVDAGDDWAPVRLRQLQISARIAAHKRREAVARWYPATVAACDASSRLRSLVDDLVQEPLPFGAPDRRARCGDALAAALRKQHVEPRLGTALLELLRLEGAIVRLTYHPPETVVAACVSPGAPVRDVSISSRVRLAPTVRLLRFAVDVLALREQPQAVEALVDAVSIGPGTVVALVRRRALQPVQLVRLGPGAMALLTACARHDRGVADLIGSFPAGSREAALASVRQAAAAGLLETA